MSETDPMSRKRRCVAMSKQTGEQCGLSPIRGGTVCKWHGGAAPQVKRSAEERLAMMVDPALDTLVALLADDTSSVRLGAVKDILDRAGYKPKEKVDLNVGYGRLSDDELNARIIELESRARSLPGPSRGT